MCNYRLRILGLISGLAQKVNKKFLKTARSKFDGASRSSLDECIKAIVPIIMNVILKIYWQLVATFGFNSPSGLWKSNASRPIEKLISR